MKYREIINLENFPIITRKIKFKNNFAIKNFIYRKNA